MSPKVYTNEPPNLTTNDFIRTHPNTRLTLPPSDLYRDGDRANLHLIPDPQPSAWEELFLPVLGNLPRPALLDDPNQIEWQSLEDPPHYVSTHHFARDWGLVSAGLPTPVRTIRTTRERAYFRNGAERKTPTLVQSFHTDTVSARPALLSLVVAALQGVLAELRKARVNRFFRDPIEHRVNLLAYWAAYPALEMHATPTPDGVETEWLNPSPYARNDRLLRADVLRPDVAALFPPADVAAHPGGYRVVIRGGFVDEIHCPEAFWAAHWWKWVPTHVAVAPDDAPVRVEWACDPVQPVRTLVLTDRPDLPPLRVDPLDVDLAWTRWLADRVKTISYDL